MLNISETYTLSDSEIDFEEQFIRNVSRDIERRIIRHLNRIEDELEIINRVCEKNRKNIVTLNRRFEEIEEDIVKFDDFLTDNKEIKEMDLKKIPVEDAKEIIYDYLLKNPGSTTSDIYIDLEIIPDVVISSLTELREENKIKGENIE